MNARIQIQLKGTEPAPNTDGSVSVDVARTNLNYLMMQKHSFYVCYHAATDSLLCCAVDQVLRSMNTGARTGPLRRL
jgi:hypothetical protein